MTQHSPLSRRTLMGCIAAALIAGPAFAQQIDINGVYDAQGRNPDGSAYSGQATVAEQSGAVEINWIVGNQHYKGTGVRDGQVVMVNFGVPAPVIYVVMSNGDLHGTWENGTALERLVRR